MKISFCIITLNEAGNLPRCLQSIAGIADEVVVLDSGSTDRTREIADQFQCRWHHQDWLGYVGQKNKAMDLARNEWVFSIDADEELSRELREEILNLKKQEQGDKISALSMPRCAFYEGRWIRHGLWYPDHLPRLFRKSRARFAGGKVHERLEFSGSLERLRGEIHHYSFRDGADHWARAQKYAQLWAETRHMEGHRCARLAPAAHAAFCWMRAFVLKRGFLDGAPGWRIARINAREVFLKYKLLLRMRQEKQPRPLRIIQFNTLFKGGGVDNQTLELAAGLRELGHCAWLGVIPGRACEPLARAEKIPLFHASKNKVRLFFQLAAFLRRERIDLIHAHHGRDYWTSIVAAKLSFIGVKVLISRHLATLPSPASRWMLLRACDGLVTVSKFVDDLIRNCMKGDSRKIHLIYGGVNAQAFASASSDDVETFRAQRQWRPEHVVCGVVGTFSFPRGKGQLEFLEAARRLRTQYPMARYAIVGTGSMRKLLKETIDQPDLAGLVTMVPFSYNMPLVMNALDILVHPAIGTEALGVVLWEALASGKPVIGSRLGGIPEAFIENQHGLLVPPGDIEALAQALRQLLDNRELRCQWGESGRAYVNSNFERGISAKQMVALYSRLLSL